MFPVSDGAVLAALSLICSAFSTLNLSVLHFQGSWWGEGDDMILIDDEEEPSINGTGAEDYFNHAWGMQRNQSPYNGTIMHDQSSDR